MVNLQNGRESSQRGIEATVLACCILLAACTPSVSSSNGPSSEQPEPSPRPDLSQLEPPIEENERLATDNGESAQGVNITLTYRYACAWRQGGRLRCMGEGAEELLSVDEFDTLWPCSGPVAT